MYEYQARLIALFTDGDTAHVEVTVVDETKDVGFGLVIRRFETVRQKLRLYGINAPEIKASGSAGEDAQAFAQQWVAMHCPDGTFTLNTFKTSARNPDDKQEKFGRYLAVITAPDGHRLNDDLVAAGQAVPYFP